MKVLVACEFSGIVREAFARRGHDAWSCDLLPTEIPGQHLQGDIRDYLNFEWGDNYWDMVIAHPPCTRLANSGVRWLKERDLWKEMYDGAEFFRMFLNIYGVKKVAVENPIPHRYALEIIGRKYDQIIQPWQFGHAETKATCLWLKNLPELEPTNVVTNPTGRVHFESPGPERWKNRSRTYRGIAEAMAEQWGSL